jgi:DDE superfamily endonuclease
VGNTKKNQLKPWLKKQYCIPAEGSAEFVCNMEDTLEVYKRPYDPRRPQICMDEGSKQLLAETQASIPMETGKPEREDYEYEREGTCSIFVACEPLAGKRYLKVSKQRTKKDWAAFMQEVIDVQYPDAEKIILVMDNLNTHVLSSFYEAFDAPTARRLVEKVELHYTPKHGSWLNMAEIELSILARQCLSDRMPSMDFVAKQVQVWQTERNQAQVTINWRFTTADARIKLKRLYPSLERKERGANHSNEE